MKCCNNYVNIGCSINCDSIILPFVADISGIHFLEIIQHEVRYNHSINATQGEQIVIPKDLFNEYGVVYFRIIQPNGVQLTDKCYSITVGMMNCCNNTLDLGCVGMCDVFRIPFKFDNDGQHKLEIQLYGNVFYREFIVTDKNNVVIDLHELGINENARIRFKIIDINGDYIIHEKNGINYDCYVVRTRIEIGNLLPNICDNPYYVIGYIDDGYFECEN